MIDALAFWLLVAAVGVAALPFAEILLGRLPGRGLVLARPLGLLLVAFPVWLLANLHLVPYRRAGAIASLVVLGLVALALRRHGLGRLGGAGNGRSIWVAGEVVFTVAFFGWALLRSFSPDVWQTEKPMDMALVNAANRADWFPPHDPWQSGTHVNYYYFGHYLVAFLVRVTGVDPAVGFNLGVAFFYALVAAAVFGVAATLYDAARRRGEAPAVSPIVPGVTAAVFAVALGNIAGGVQFLQDTSRFATYDWWSPSRVIEGTANEFPFFSFLLADLHAHMLVTPFALLTVAYAVQLALEGPPALAGRRLPARAAAELLLAALALGALYATNSFDFPTACVIGAGALLLWVLEAPGRVRKAAVWAAAWIAASIVLYLPFWIGFSPPASSIGLVREREALVPLARDYAFIYGLSLWVVLALFAGRLRVPFRYIAWGGSVLLFVLVLLEPSQLAGRLVVLLVAAAALYLALASGAIGQAHRVLWLLTAAALGLVASGEIVYLRDAFDGTASFRFNTVFKTGYQAWFLLTIVAGVGVYWSARWLGRRLRIVWLAGLAALVALALVYPVAGSYSRSGRFDRDPTLDGMAWLERAAPDDAAAIAWLRTSVRGVPTLLETVGRDFDPDGRARVSTFTGLPAVMGWAGHEVQWGHDPASRLADVQEIYRTTDDTVARQLLEQYGVDYVFVGELERRDYPADGLAKFARLGTPAFRSGQTVVYELRASSEETTR
jgi:YYY domain-containing protein